MEKQNENLRDRLLAHLPDPARSVEYKEEVQTALARRARRLRIEKWFMRAFWLYVIALLMVFLYRGESFAETPHGHRFTIAVIVLFICGAIEILKHMINRSRVEMLTEIKQVQLQVLELQASLRKTGNE
jgi:asparagine N-glycosylation enzyme membrane subunit Stt3